jgi:hypothetical protein
VADDTLSGTDGSETYMVAANGAQIPMAPSSRDEPEQGTGLALTLDRDLQWWTQRRLRTAVRETGAESATAVLTHVETGQVLSLAEWPTVDPNNPGSVTETDRGSRAVQNVFEPGSVQKLMTFAALLDRGIVTPRTKINVPAARTFDGEEVGDWWDHGRLRMTATGVLAQSSNLGTITAASSLPDAVLERYLRKFGLGQRTGIGLPGESPGIVNPASDWLDITRATIAFGQGPVHHRGADGRGGEHRGQRRGVRGAVADAGRAAWRRRRAGRAAGHAPGRVGPGRRAAAAMMEEVTAPNGTAPAAAIPGYRVAGQDGDRRAGLGDRRIRRDRHLVRRLRTGRRPSAVDVHRAGQPGQRRRRRVRRRADLRRRHVVRAEPLRHSADRADRAPVAQRVVSGQAGSVARQRRSTSDRPYAAVDPTRSQPREPFNSRSRRAPDIGRRFTARRPPRLTCPGVGGLPAAADVTVSGLTLDSRAVRPGDLYAALPGGRTHGARFVAAVVDAGAAPC